MRILLIGDPHFRKNNLHIMRHVTQEILEIIDKRQVDLVIDLGDTLDRYCDFPAQIDAIKFFKQIAERCELVVLIGNHDRQNNSDFLSDVHPFTGLEKYPNITIVDTTVWDKQKNFIYVPYVTPGRFNEALSKVGYYPFVNGVVNLEQKVKFIFSHQDYMNRSNGKITFTDGDVWSQLLPQIFSGHIHKYQLLPKICYVGTFMQENYGEDTDKALMLIQLEDNDQYTAERIRLNSIPLRIEVHLNASELSNFASKIPAGYLVKVWLHMDATEVTAVRQSPHYKAMKNTVDMVTEKIVSNKANIAEKLITEFKEKGSLPDKFIYDIDELVIAMLQDDPHALNIYQTEIAM